MSRDFNFIAHIPELGELLDNILSSKDMTIRRKALITLIQKVIEYDKCTRSAKENSNGGCIKK